MNRRLAALALGILMPLAACGSSDREPQSEAARGGVQVESPGGISVSGGKLVLPAVKGRPGALYFTLSNATNEPIDLVGVSVDQTESTMLHTSKSEGGVMSMNPLAELSIAPGGSAPFVPGGNHGMVEGIAPTVTAGTTLEATAILRSGDKVTFPVSVETVAGGGGS